MPFISTKTSVPVSAESEKNIKEKLGHAITIIGKTESWLMLDFEDNRRMYFKGDDTAPMAFVEVKLFGKASPDLYSKMTARICEILGDELNIPADRIYVKYEEVQNWGWNGANF